MLDISKIILDRVLFTIGDKTISGWDLRRFLNEKMSMIDFYIFMAKLEDRNLVEGFWQNSNNGIRQRAYRKCK